MKRRALPALAALMLLLAGCGGAEDAGRRPYQPSDVQALLDAGAFTGRMEEVDAYVAAIFYGVNEDDVEGCACYMAADTSVSADEAAVLVLRDEAAAQAAVEGMEKRRDSLIGQCGDYCPDQVPKLEDAVILRRGNTALFAVGDRDTLAPALERLELG